MIKATYKDKLLDPRWQKKRLEILDRDKWACKLCSDTTTTLHVHHKRYTGDPWEASEDDLITYCSDCHLFIEEYSKHFEIIKSSKFKYLDEVYLLCFVKLEGRSAMINVVLINGVWRIGPFLYPEDLLKMATNLKEL